MTGQRRNVTRAALVLALASSGGVLVAVPAMAAIGDITGTTTTTTTTTTTPLPSPTLTTSPLPLPLPVSTDTTLLSSPSPTASSSPSPTPTSSPTATPAPTSDPTPSPAPTATSTPATTTQDATTQGTTTQGTTSTVSAPTNTSAGSVSGGATLAGATTRTATGSAGLTDVTGTAGRLASTSLLGLPGLAPAGAGGSPGLQRAAVDPTQVRWSDGLGELMLPAIPAGGGSSATAALRMPGMTPLVAGAPGAGAGMRVTARPVLTTSRTVPTKQGDPVGLALFACVAAALAAGLSRRRGRGY